MGAGGLPAAESPPTRLSKVDSNDLAAQSGPHTVVDAGYSEPLEGAKPHSRVEVLEKAVAELQTHVGALVRTLGEVTTAMHELSHMTPILEHLWGQMLTCTQDMAALRDQVAGLQGAARKAGFAIT